MREDEVNEICHKIVTDNDKCFYDRILAIASNGGEITAYGLCSPKELYELLCGFLDQCPQFVVPVLMSAVHAIGGDIEMFDINGDDDDDDD